MEDINEENVQSFSIKELEELYKKYYYKIEKIEEQINQLEDEKFSLLLFKDIIKEAISKKEREEEKEQYEKYIGKYYVHIKASTDPIYYHFKSVIDNGIYIRLFGTSVSPIDSTITAGDHFDIHNQYDRTNLLKEISKDEFDKQLQNVVETL